MCWMCAVNPGRGGSASVSFIIVPAACSPTPLLATGYFCPAGSRSPTTAPCQPGTYSTLGSAACSNCSAGLFGDSIALTTALCSGDCPAGSYCLEASPQSVTYGVPCGCPLYLWVSLEWGFCELLPLVAFCYQLRTLSRV